MFKSLCAPIAAVALITLAPATARAQASTQVETKTTRTETQGRGRGDGFFVGALPYGGVIGGGDAHLFKNFGVGAESGLITYLGYVAPYAIVHLPARGTDVVPFVTAGYVMLRDMEEAEGYFGPSFSGGLEYWFRPNKTAFRFEVSLAAPARHGYADGLVLVRVGVSFR